MADTYFPILNPIRLHNHGTSIDYSSIMPNQDNIELKQSYQRGIYAGSYYPVFECNSILKLLIYNTDYSSTFTARIRNSETTVKYPVSINRINATSKYLLITIRFATTYPVPPNGYYRVDIFKDSAIIAHSDTFKVVNWIDKKDLVKITFYDSQNRYGSYFYINDLNIYKGITFYTGNVEPADPEDEPITYTNDPGDTVLLQSTPQRVSLLTLCDIHSSYIDVVKHQTCCSDFYVNDIKYVVSDFSTSKKEKSDIVDITMKLKMSDTDYFLKS